MRFHPQILFATALACVGVLASAQTATKAPASTAAKKSAAPASSARPTGAPMTDDQKAIYSIGLNIYGSLSQFNLSPAELELVKRAMSDAANGKPAVDAKVWLPKVDGLLKSRAGQASAVYSAKAAAEPGAVKTPSGLIFKELKAGTGATPSATDTVKVNYRGTFINGKEFDSSYSRNQPAEFPLNGVIKCWTEGVQKMKPGSKARLVCPSDIAYGDQGRPGIPGGSTLVFEIELLSVTAK